MQAEWKWSRRPNLKALEESLRSVVGQWYQSPDAERAIRYLTEQLLVRRIAAGRLATEDGTEYPAPDYSKAYMRRKKKLGYKGDTTIPNYTLSGNMLAHLKARLKSMSATRVDLIISVWGGRNDNFKKEKGVTISGNKYLRPAYTVTPRPGSNETRTYIVPATWITIGRNGARVRKSDVSGNVRSNAQLMGILARRLGGGRWAQGGKPPNSLMRLTRDEQEWIYAEFRRWCAAKIAHEAGLTLGAST
jgi:hypothetical protein